MLLGWAFCLNAVNQRVLNKASQKGYSDSFIHIFVVCENAPFLVEFTCCLTYPVSRIYPSGFVLSIFWPRALNFVKFPICYHQPKIMIHQCTVILRFLPAILEYRFSQTRRIRNPHLPHSCSECQEFFLALQGLMSTLLGHPQTKAP